MSASRLNTASALLVAGIIGTGCSDRAPTAPSEPLPVTTTTDQVVAYVTLVSADAQRRLLPSMTNRALANDVAQRMTQLDAALVSRNRTKAEEMLRDARAALDRAGPADLGDAHAVHLALNVAVELIGLPFSAMRHVAGVSHR